LHGGPPQQPEEPKKRGRPAKTKVGNDGMYAKLSWW
jgi:hypothetical protein